MYDALRAVYGAGAVDLDDRVDDARRISKAEAHIRFHIDKKNLAVETLERSKQLIGWGGESRSTRTSAARKRAGSRHSSRAIAGTYSGSIHSATARR